MSDLTVSSPDLTGFGDFSTAVGEQAAELSIGLSALPVPTGTSGQLSDVLALFLDDLAALIAELINLALAVYLEAANVTKWGVDMVLDFFGGLSAGASGINAAGLTEEPNDCAGSDEVLAGSQQSQY